MYSTKPERIFEEPKDFLMALLMFLGVTFLGFGSVAFLKYVTTPPTPPQIQVEIGEIDASQTTTTQVTATQTTECGVLSWNCSGDK